MPENTQKLCGYCLSASDTETPAVIRATYPEKDGWKPAFFCSEHAEFTEAVDGAVLEPYPQQNK